MPAPKASLITNNLPEFPAPYPELALQLTLSIVHSKVLDKCAVTCICHYNARAFVVF